MLSIVESDYIAQGANADVRIDARPRLDYRPIALEVGVIPYASGSCRCRALAADDDSTDIAVAIKAEIWQRSTVGGAVAGDDAVKAVQCHVEFALGSGRGLTDRQNRDQANDLAQFLNRTLNNVDFTPLVLVPDKLAWILHIDVTV
jgi:exosome complex component RRP42